MAVPKGGLVAHVELELSDPFHPEPYAPGEYDTADRVLDRWAVAVGPSREACLLLDAAGIVAGASVGFSELLGVARSELRGRRLVDGVLRLLDFGSEPRDLPDWEVEKIPPLFVLNSGGLARGLIRFCDPTGAAQTLDAITTPLRDGKRLVGSLTFFAPVS
jgi:hypothetical protein